MTSTRRFAVPSGRAHRLDAAAIGERPNLCFSRLVTALGSASAIVSSGRCGASRCNRSEFELLCNA
jgi:hypothetical protein